MRIKNKYIDFQQIAMILEKYRKKKIQYLAEKQYLCTRVVVCRFVHSAK